MQNQNLSYPLSAYILHAISKLVVEQSPYVHHVFLLQKFDMDFR